MVKVHRVELTGIIHVNTVFSGTLKADAYIVTPNIPLALEFLDDEQGYVVEGIREPYNDVEVVDLKINIVCSKV